MQENYARDFDLNLLRVFVVVASARSVTRAASQLYLTQPAVSAALRRLTRAVGAPLFVRSGRGLILSQRGERLYASVRPLLEDMVEAALAPPTFDPATSERSLRLGLSDAMEGWLLAPLLRALERTAPRLRLIALPVQFRTIGDVLASRSVDLAITVADELPSSIRRQPLLHSAFVCLFDPKRVKLKSKISEREYFAHDHVIVSYNGDLRGVVEDLFQKQRRVRCSVASFSHVGAIVEGSALLATVPGLIAQHLLALHPGLRTVPAPFPMDGGTPLELLWPSSNDDDEACRFLREQVVAVVQGLPGALKKPKPVRRERT
jgi:LysR family transcriptional regulator, mexEF-oprN operon transcriptional activator